MTRCTNGEPADRRETEKKGDGIKGNAKMENRNKVVKRKRKIGKLAVSHKHFIINT